MALAMLRPTEQSTPQQGSKQRGATRCVRRRVLKATFCNSFTSRIYPGGLPMTAKANGGDVTILNAASRRWGRKRLARDN